MRQFIRHPSDIPIEFRPDSASYAACDRLSNVSHGGLSFLSAKTLPVGTTLWVKITSVKPAFEAPVRVSWCHASDDHYEVGAEFVAVEDEYRARMVEQICYIEHYKREVLREQGRMLTGQEAAEEWIQRYAGQFPPLSDGSEDE